MAKEKRGLLEPVYHPDTIRNDEKGVCDPNELGGCPEWVLPAEQQTVA